MNPTPPFLRPFGIAGLLLALAMAGERAGAPTAQDASAAAQRGASLFTGKAHCGACHAVGGDEKGRGPDLEGIGGRAAERGAAFGLSGSHAGTSYLFRSLLHPADEVVEGYNPMPESWLASGLDDDEIADLVVYLQSLGGHAAPGEVELPPAWLAAKRKDYEREVQLTSIGDPARGKALFFDEKGNAGCVRCHSIDGEGKDICPDLTSVHFVQRPLYVLESVLDSSAFIVHGYRQLMLQDDSGVLHVGLKVDEDEDVVVLVIDDAGTTEEVWKDEIVDQGYSEVSRMPGNFADLLTARQVLDLVAFVLRHDELRAPTTEGTEAPEAAMEELLAAAQTPFPELTEDQERYRLAMSKGDRRNGASIYAHYCTPCHGTDGTGTGFNAVNLETKPANHTDDRRMAKTEDRLLHGVITRGGMKTGRSFLMPPWGGTLKEREIWDLVAYLRTLHARIPPVNHPG